MLTDARPRNCAGFLESDRIRTLDLPQNGRLLTIAKSIESGMRTGKAADVRRACDELLAATSDFYKLPTCAVRVRRLSGSRKAGFVAAVSDFALIVLVAMGGFLAQYGMRPQCISDNSRTVSLGF